MIFSSLEFIYLFLPPVLAGFFLLRRLGWENGVIWWLIAASLAFYTLWSPIHLLLLLASVGTNYALHLRLSQRPDRSVLALGITANLGALAYFKYADFFIANLNAASGLDLPMLEIILPLAISFFTFQQISLLYDTFKGEVRYCDFSRYALFVVFFPQLIAGPIVLQKDTLPQFSLKTFGGPVFLNISIGATLFAIGLFKKIVLADGVAPIANDVFGLADSGEAVPLTAAWMGALAYSFQIYFDFSGYCDMAIGLARMFGVRLPMNFNSPYKSRSIIEFWRRWHITLSRFLRDYLYIPLGGNRRGPWRRQINLLATMTLGGLWHGASWNFVIWGVLHGLFLAVNHAWNGMWSAPLRLPLAVRILLDAASRALTLLAVIVAWVFFRAETLDGAVLVLEGMAGMAFAVDAKLWEASLSGGASFWTSAALLGAYVLFAPNAIELTRRYRPVIDTKGALDRLAWSGLAWRPTPAWSAAIAGVGLVAVIQIYRLGDLTEFIYFNF